MAYGPLRVRNGSKMTENCWFSLERPSYPATSEWANCKQEEIGEICDWSIAIFHLSFRGPELITDCPQMTNEK